MNARGRAVGGSRGRSEVDRVRPGGPFGPAPGNKTAAGSGSRRKRMDGRGRRGPGTAKGIDGSLYKPLPKVRWGADGLALLASAVRGSGVTPAPPPPPTCESNTKVPKFAANNTDRCSDTGGEVMKGKEGHSSKRCGKGTYSCSDEGVALARGRGWGGAIAHCATASPTMRCRLAGSQGGGGEYGPREGNGHCTPHGLTCEASWIRWTSWDQGCHAKTATRGGGRKETGEGGGGGGGALEGNGVLLLSAFTFPESKGGYDLP